MLLMRADKGSKLLTAVLCHGRGVRQTRSLTYEETGAPFFGQNL